MKEPKKKKKVTHPRFYKEQIRYLKVEIIMKNNIIQSLIEACSCNIPNNNPNNNLHSNSDNNNSMNHSNISFTYNNNSNINFNKKNIITIDADNKKINSGTNIINDKTTCNL